MQTPAASNAGPELRRTLGSLGRKAAMLGFAVLGLQAFARTVNAMELVVPAYYDPKATGGSWADIATTASKVTTTVIANPNSGPGVAEDPLYTSAIARVHAAGGKVIGYVSTSYSKRALSAVVKDINRYIAFYKLDGFFIDEMSSDNVIAHVQYYQSVYNYVKGLSPNFVVIANPGTNMPEMYASLPTADRFVVFEDTATHYARYTPAAWQLRYPKSRFLHMVYNVSAAQMAGTMQYAAAHQASAVFITQLTLPNPYKALPGYWTQEITSARALK
jgi:hypothetical protein